MSDALHGWTNTTNRGFRPLDQIEQLRIQEWHEHRFAPRTINVRAKIRGQRELAFSSTLRGDSKQIINCLVERIPQIEFVPFQP